MTLRPDVSQIPFLANVLAAMPDRVGQRLQTIPSSPNSHALRDRSEPISLCSIGATKVSYEQLILKPPSQVIVPGMKHLITLPGMPL